MDLNERAYNYYRYFIAIKLHFTSSSFDFFKTNGKTRASYSAYMKRKDRYFFEKTAKVFNTQKFLDKCLTEVKVNRNFCSKDILTPDNEARYLKRKGYLEAFGSSLDKEISQIIGYCLKNGVTKEALILGTDETKPILYNLMAKGILTEESFLCFHKVYGILDYLDRTGLDPLVTDTVFFLKKYNPFVLKYFPKKSELENLINKQFTLLEQNSIINV